MAWDRNDFMAAGLILAIIILAVIIGLYVSGAWNPSIDTVFPFK